MSGCHSCLPVALTSACRFAQREHFHKVQVAVQRQIKQFNARRATELEKDESDHAEEAAHPSEQPSSSDATPQIATASTVVPPFMAAFSAPPPLVASREELTHRMQTEVVPAAAWQCALLWHKSSCQHALGSDAAALQEENLRQELLNSCVLDSKTNDNDGDDDDGSFGDDAQEMTGKFPVSDLWRTLVQFAVQFGDSALALKVRVSSGTNVYPRPLPFVCVSQPLTVCAPFRSLKPCWSMVRRIANCSRVQR